MMRSRRTTDLFGAPQPFSNAKLPKFGEVLEGKGFESNTIRCRFGRKSAAQESLVLHRSEDQKEKSAAVIGELRVK